MAICVDLFAGAGGFSLAARRAGFHIRLAIEHDKNAAATYARNLGVPGEPPIIVRDDISQLSAENVGKTVFEPDESCDLLLGGPPCQGFSAHRLKDSGVQDERNKLVGVYFEFVRQLRPKMFLMENVPGMLWERHAHHVESLYCQGKRAGYTMFKPETIDARNYGVPQRRKRVFILGVRREIGLDGFIWPPKRTHGSDADCADDPQLRPWTNCSAAFRAAPPEDPNDVHMRHNAELVAAFEKTPHNGGSRASSGRVLRCHSKHDGHSDVYGRIDPRQPAPTMTTACINPSKGRFVHPTLPHGITVRQAARIQTFPDDFVFLGGLMAAGEQVGNAVPVKLGEVLVKHIAQLLERRDSASDRCAA